MVKLQLVLASRRLIKLRERQRVERQQRLMQQLWEAWQLRQFSLVHRLRVQLSRSGNGVEKLVLAAPAAGTLEESMGGGGFTARHLAETSRHWHIVEYLADGRQQDNLCELLGLQVFLHRVIMTW